MTRAEAIEFNMGDALLFLEPAELDEAILGVANDFMPLPRVVYSVPKLVEIYASLMAASDTPYEDALEFVSFNVTGAWLGDQNPIYVYHQGTDNV